MSGRRELEGESAKETAAMSEARLAGFVIARMQGEPRDPAK